MACVSVGSCWENRHPQMRSQSLLFIVAWEQTPEHMLLEGGFWASHRLPVSPRSPATIKGVSLPCVKPQDLCVQYMARNTHTQGISPPV